MNGDNSAWARVGLTVLALVISIGVLWGTFTTQIEATERRVEAIELREDKRDQRLLEIQVQLARIEERLVAIQSKLG